MAQYNFPPNSSPYGPGDRTYKNMPGQRYGSSGPDGTFRAPHNAGYAQSEAEVARAQARAVADAEQSDYLKRIQETRNADAKKLEQQLQQRKMFEQEAARFATRNKVPIERARQLLDPNNEFGGARPAPVTPKQSALKKMLGKVSGGRFGGTLGVLGMLPALVEGGNIVSGRIPAFEDPEIGRMQ